MGAIGNNRSPCGGERKYEISSPGCTQLGGEITSISALDPRIRLRERVGPGKRCFEFLFLFLFFLLQWSLCFDLTDTPCIPPSDFNSEAYHCGNIHVFACAVLFWHIVARGKSYSFILPMTQGQLAWLKAYVRRCSSYVFKYSLFPQAVFVLELCHRWFCQ